MPLYFTRTCTRVCHELGSPTRVQQAIDASSHQPWPWSGLGVTLVNLLWSLGVILTNVLLTLGVMRSRRDACPVPLYSARSRALVFHPKLYPCVSRIGLADESPAGHRHFLSSAMALQWPWSYPGQSNLESGGDALKTGRVTSALVQCPKLCPCISPEVVPEYVTSWARRRESSRPSTLPPISHGLGVALELR